MYVKPILDLFYPHPRNLLLTYLLKASTFLNHAMFQNVLSERSL